MSAFAVTAEKSALLKVLTDAQRAVERRVTIPILSHVRLEASADRLHITATDLDLQVDGALACTVDGEGTLTVPASTFFDYVRKQPDGAQIALSASGGRLLVRVGRSRATLPILPAEDFPELTLSGAGGVPHSFEIAAAALVSAFGRASYAICTDETRYYLAGVYMHAVSEGLAFVATDGHRLARIVLPLPNGAQSVPGIIIPRKTVAEILRLAQAVKGEAAPPISFQVGETRLVATIGDIRITSKLIDGTYPDYQRVIPQAQTKAFRVETAALASALDRVSSVAGERGRAVRFDFGDEAIGLSITGDAGSAEEEVAGKLCQGEPITIGFNGAYVAATLAALGTAETLIELDQAGGPGLLRAPDDAAALFVVMPVRV